MEEYIYNYVLTHGTGCSVVGSVYHNHLLFVESMVTGFCKVHGIKQPSAWEGICPWVDNHYRYLISEKCDFNTELYNSRYQDGPKGRLVLRGVHWDCKYVILLYWIVD